MMFRPVLALAFVVAAVMPAPAAESPWPDITGRWRAKSQVQHTLPIRALDIARCPGGLCCRVVNEDGSCGPTVLRLTENRTGTLHGTILVEGISMPAYASPQAEWLLVGAFRRSADPNRKVLPLVAEYDRQGPPRCGRAIP